MLERHVHALPKLIHMETFKYKALVGVVLATPSLHDADNAHAMHAVDA